MSNVSVIHPILIHFPIALGITGLFFEYLSLLNPKPSSNSSCGEWLLYLATFSALLAVIAGNFFTESFIGKAEEIKNIHSTFAGTTLFFYFLTSALYIYQRFYFHKYPILTSSFWRKVGLGSYTFTALLVGITGYFGGMIVYNYMIK